MIINIVADNQFPLFDAQATDVIVGLVYDPNLNEEVSVTVIATGYDSEYKIEAAELVELIPLFRVREFATRGRIDGQINAHDSKYGVYLRTTARMLVGLVAMGLSITFMSFFQG